jgi:hypothetical protein
MEAQPVLGIAADKAGFPQDGPSPQSSPRRGEGVITALRGVNVYLRGAMISLR